MGAEASPYGRLATPAVLLIASFAYLLTGIALPLGLFDEGLELTAAMRILGGEVPYRDFWFVYAPGEPYLLAGLFRVFGPSVMGARVMDTALRALLALATWAVARRLAPGGVAFAAWLAVTLWLGPQGFYRIPIFSYPVVPALLVVMASMLCLLPTLGRDERRVSMFGSVGLCAGIAALFRQDFGLYALAVEGGVLAVLTASRRRGWIGLVGFAVGVTAIVGPVAAWLVAVIERADLVHSLFVWPAVVQPAVRGLPYPAPSLDTAPFYLPLLVCVAGLAVGAVRLCRGDADAWELLVPAILGVAFLNHSRMRPDAPHFLSTFVVALPVGAALVARGIAATRGIALATAAAALAGLALITVPLARARPVSSATASPDHGLPRARGIPVEADQAATARWIRERVPKREPIFVGMPRHDRLVLNDASFYFLAGRDCASYYHQMDPGSATTLPAQTRMIADLERRGVRYVVIFSGFEGIIEPNASAVSSGVHALDDFLRRRFAPEVEFGRYAVWRKR